MPAGTEVPPLMTPQLRRQDWFAVPLLILVSAVILLVVYLQSNWPGNWISGAPALNWNGAALKLTKGQGEVRDGVLAIDALDEQGFAVAALSTPAFRARDYSAVSWTIGELPPDAQLAFLWRTVEYPDRISARPLKVSRSGVATLEMDGEENWQGQIMGLALTVKGQLDAPLLVKGVSLKPVSAKGAVAKILGRWFVPEGWLGTSINFVDGDAADQDVSYVTAVAALLVLSLVLYACLARFKRVRAHAAVVWCLVFLGWFALDARWQWNLLRQLDLTSQQFAGKSWENKHLAADDGKLFAFMQQVKAKLPAKPERVLYFADDAYLRGKGSYFLYPQNVLASEGMLAASRFKPGDHIVLVEKKGVQYETSRQSLEWPGGQVPADVVFSSGSNFLLKVR